MVRPDLPRTSSSGSGFFFCGIRLEPVATASWQFEEAELFGREEDDVLGQPAEVHHRHGAGVKEASRRSRGRLRYRCCSARRGEAKPIGEPCHIDVVAGAGDRARSRAASSRSHVARSSNR